MYNKRFFKRTYRLILENETTGSKKEFSNLNIKFNIKRYVAQHQFEASIDILGLTFDTMSDLAQTSIYDMFTAAKKYRRRITLYAGYDGRETALFSGYVIHAMIDTPPEMWLHIKAQNYTDFTAQSKPYDISLKGGISLRQAFEAVARELDMYSSYQYNGVNETIGKTGCGKTLHGTKTQVIQQLNDLGDWQVYYDAGYLKAIDKPFASGANKTPKYTANKENGLIRVNSVDVVGVTFTAYLNTDADLAQYVKLESELMPVANGTYFIYQIEYKGDYYGNDWHIVINGRRQRGSTNG